MERTARRSRCRSACAAPAAPPTQKAHRPRKQLKQEPESELEEVDVDHAGILSGRKPDQWPLHLPDRRWLTPLAVPGAPTIVKTLTYRQAAARTRRSIRTINRWRKRGMPMTWELRGGQRVRVVEERILLAWWRDRMTADPVHQIRLRRALAAQAVQDGDPSPAPIESRSGTLRGAHDR